MGEHTEVVDRIDISNWRRLGFSEFNLVKDMINCANALSKLEDEEVLKISKLKESQLKESQLKESQLKESQLKESQLSESKNKNNLNWQNHKNWKNWQNRKS